jgi:hypothetical protein
MAKQSPTAKSMALLKGRGYIVARGEQWIPGANIRRDLFGFGDLLVAMPEAPCTDGYIALVQVTTKSNMNAREKKIRSLPEFRAWWNSGGLVYLHGWDGKELTEKGIVP